MSDSLWPHGLQHARPPCPWPTPGVYSNSCPFNWWCLLTVSPAVIHFSRLQAFPALGSFFFFFLNFYYFFKFYFIFKLYITVLVLPNIKMSQFFAWGGQSIGVSASTSVLPMNNQDWSPSEWTGWISLQSKGLSKVFSNTTVRKHQFFGTQLSL